MRLFIKTGSVMEEEHQKGLAHLIEHMAFNGSKNFPDKNAVISEYGTRTFQELNANSNCYANFLLANDLRPGDSVAIICKNRPEFLEALFGPLRVGMRITPINWHLTPEEICYIVENSFATM